MMKGPLNRISNASLLLLLLFAGVAIGFFQAAAQEKQALGSLSPEKESEEIMLKACVQCHDLTNTRSQRKTLEGWRRTINEMAWRGAPLIGDEAETLSRYLAQAFGPEKGADSRQSAESKKTVGDEKVEKPRDARNLNKKP